MEQLCRTYWYPLYGYIRRRGHNPADAEDLTQAFLTRLLEKDWLAVADQTRGRFRTFLLASLNHFLANEWDKSRAQKRGGGSQLVSLDATSGETRLGCEPIDHRSPDREFDRRWALALLDVVLNRVKTEYTEQNKSKLFESLKGTLGMERGGTPYAELGKTLGVSEGAVRVSAHRLRQRYRELLREEIAQTVDGASAVEDELRHLFEALGG